MKKKRVLIPVIIAVVAVIVCIIIFGSNGNENSNNTTSIEPSSNNNWVSPGKIFVENYVPGKGVMLEVQIHNGNPTPTEFSVGYRYPDQVAEGYSKPTGVSDWVQIGERFPVIEAHGTYTVPVWLHMPSTAKPPGNKWEFWIGVIDKSQTDTVITELAVRILVTMK